MRKGIGMRKKVRLHLKHGIRVTVKVDDFEVTRGADGVPTAWNATGIGRAFGFNPTDLVFWEVR